MSLWASLDRRSTQQISAQTRKVEINTLPNISQVHPVDQKVRVSLMNKRTFSGASQQPSLHIANPAADEGKHDSRYRQTCGIQKH